MNGASILAALAGSDQSTDVLYTDPHEWYADIDFKGAQSTYGKELSDHRNSSVNALSALLGRVNDFIMIENFRPNEYYSCAMIVFTEESSDVTVVTHTSENTLLVQLPNSRIDEVLELFQLNSIESDSIPEFAGPVHTSKWTLKLSLSKNVHQATLNRPVGHIPATTCVGYLAGTVDLNIFRSYHLASALEQFLNQVHKSKPLDF